MTKVTESSGNIFTDLNVTLTLDDVSNRINAICDGYLADAMNAKAKYQGELNALSAAVDASTDLDKDAVGKVVFGRVRKLLAELVQALG